MSSLQIVKSESDHDLVAIRKISIANGVIISYYTDTYRGCLLK